MEDATWADQDLSDVLQLDDGDEAETEEPKLLTPSDVLDMAAYLEIDTVNEIWLFPLARDAVLAELPEGWVEKLDENEDPYYVNKAQGITTDEHPTDDKYRRKVAKARKRGPPEKVNKWMDFMDENNRRFFYNFEKNIAKYESLDEPMVPAVAATSNAAGMLTPQPPAGVARTPGSSQRSGWATPDGSQGDPPGSGGSSKFSQLRDLPLNDVDPDPEEDDDEADFMDDSQGMMNRMMMTSDIGAALGEIEELDDDLVERAEALGVTPHSESALMWIVHDSLERLHVLPDGWVVEQDDDSSDGFPLYSCPAAGVSKQAAHPLDEFYRFGVMLCRRKELRPQVDGPDPVALAAELDDASKKYKALKKRLRRAEGERNDKEDELQLVQTEYWDLKKACKKRDAEVAELQAQNLNLSTELRAMRRELSAAGSAAGSGGSASTSGEAPVDSATTGTVQPPAAAPKATPSADETQLAALQQELTQLKNRNRQLEAMQASQFGPGASVSHPTAGSLVPQHPHKLTAEEEEKLEFVRDLGGVAKVRQLLQQSDDAEIKETARELLATLPQNAEEILAAREKTAANASDDSTDKTTAGEWKLIAEERSATAEAAKNRVAELELQLKKAKKQVKALQSIAQADGDAGSSDVAARAVASIVQSDSKELEMTRAARQSAEKRCEALEVQLKSQQELVQSLGLQVKKQEAALVAASAKGKGKEQAAASAAAAQESIAVMENKLEQERQSWREAEAKLRDSNAADVKRIQDKLDSQSAELLALQSSAAAAAEARGDAVQSLKSAQQDLETETAARKAAQTRADDAAGKLATTEAKLQAALGAAKTQSQYLIKLARELKTIRATFDEISAAVTLHRTVNFESVLKLVTTAAMPAAEVAKAMASIETDAARRLPELMVERKRLQNEIQELRGNIRVIARVRPLSEKEKAGGEKECVSFPASGELAITNEKQRTIDFEYDFVARQDCGQVEVFKEVRAVAQSVLDGYNCCIFAYGQTGSGKTHTMTGSTADPGVNVRLVEELFAISGKAWTGQVYTFRVSMVEIYNEALRDLLAVPPSKKNVAQADKKASLDVRLNQDGSLEVVGLEEAVCGSAHEAQKVMEAGLKNRAVGATAMNAGSSRSHLVMTIRCDSHNAQTGRGSCSKLHLVDLAGSERLSRTEATGDRLKEAQSINKSLSSLGDVMAALARKDKHVPYRNSKLTYFLQDSLGGDSKTVMFVNISPTLASAQETETSLRFASRVRKVELGPAKKQSKGGNSELSAAAKAKYEALVGTKEQQVLQLQQELTAVKTRLKMVESGSAGGGGKRPSASGRTQAGGLPPATKQSGQHHHGRIGARIPQAGRAAGPGEVSLEQFMSSAIGGGSPNKPKPGAPPGVGPRGRRIVR